MDKASDQSHPVWQMDRSVDTLVKLILFAADDDGRIPFPRGDKTSVRILRLAMACMKRRGLVERGRDREPACLPYTLTEAGVALREEIKHEAFRPLK